MRTAISYQRQTSKVSRGLRQLVVRSKRSVIVGPAKLFDSVLSVEQHLDLAAFQSGAETSQLMGFSARPLAGPTGAEFAIKVARL